MFAQHAEKMNFEIIDERPNISIFDAAEWVLREMHQRMLQLAYPPLRFALELVNVKEPRLPGIYGGHNSAIGFFVI